MSAHPTLPNLIIIGAMKCGTTSLHFYLRFHPQIRMSREKELDFFVEEFNWSKGVGWYASRFRPAEVRGESSPSYSSALRFPGVPARMHAVVPAAKLIYLIRDPVKRLVSHYVHNYSSGRESRTLTEAARDPMYIDRSLYRRQLDHYLQYYPESSILVMEADELLHQRRAALRRVFEFLGVDPDAGDPRHALRRHTSMLKRRRTATGDRIAETRLARWIKSLPPLLRSPARDLLYRPFSRRIPRPVLDTADRRELEALLREDAQGLRALTGLELARWCV